MIATQSRGRVFSGLHDYLKAGRDGRHPERVEWSATRNLRPGLSRPDKAMQRAATLNDRVTKPVLHLTFNAVPGEHLSQAQWEAAVERVLENLGLEERQAMIVAHNDRRHEHVHVMVNTVHPESGEAWDASYSKLRTNAVVHEIERDYGLAQVTRAPAGARIAWDAERQADAIREYLISRGTSFTEDELRVWSEWRDQGEEIVARVLRDSRIQPLELADGSYRYTDQATLDQEAAVFRAADELVARGGFVVSAPEVARLDDHQRDGLAHVLEGQDLAILVGRAGTGKTTMLEPAVAAWRASGYRVLGAALAGKAADGLGNETGIESRTLDSWRMSWQRGSELLDSETVLVIDEAGMVDTAHLADVLDRAAEAQAKVVLIGDPDQLQPVAPGAPLRQLVAEHGAAYLETIWRQHDEWQRAATLELANGQVESAIAVYTEHERVSWTETRAEARNQLVAQYLYDRAAHLEGSQLALSYRNEDVAHLNKAIRTGLVVDGHLGSGITDVYRRAWSEGDRLIFLRNDHKQRHVRVTDGDAARGVSNGTLGTVERATTHELAVRLDDGRQVTFAPSDYRHYDYGYAATVHRSQGMTVDRAYVLADGLMDRNAAYVALSRHRASVALYADVETQASPEELALAWSRAHDGPLVRELDLASPEPYLQAAVVEDVLRGHPGELETLSAEESANLPVPEAGPQMTAEERAHFFRSAAPSLETLSAEESAQLPVPEAGPQMTAEERAHFLRNAAPSLETLSAEESAQLPVPEPGPQMTAEEREHFLRTAAPSLETLSPEESAQLPVPEAGPQMTAEERAHFLRTAAPSLETLSPEESAQLPVPEPGAQMTAEEREHFLRNAAPTLETLSPEESANLPVPQHEHGSPSGGQRLTPEEVEHFGRRLRHELEPEERRVLALELEKTARTLEAQNAPLDVVARLRALDLEKATAQAAARELALIQRQVSLQPAYVAELAALRAHAPQIYDAANNRFFDRPAEVTPQRLRQLVLDAGALDAHQRLGGEAAAFTHKLERAELEAANLAQRGVQRGQAEQALARTLAQQYRDPEAAAARLVAMARRDGVGDALQRLQVHPREFGDMRGTRFRRDRMATDRAVQRDLRLSGQTGHGAALAKATANVRHVSGQLSALKLQLTQLEPHDAITLRMKGHTKALGTKLAMKVVLGALPPQLQVPVRLAYHAAKLGQKITGMGHEL